MRHLKGVFPIKMSLFSGVFQKSVISAFLSSEAVSIAGQSHFLSLRASLSPGQMTQAAHPPVWLNSSSTPSCMIDITQHALKGQKLCKLSGFLKLLPLQGALFATHKNPGRCPGLRASAPSGRAAYIGFLPSGRAAYIGFLPSGRVAYMGFLAFWVCYLYGL